MSGSMIIYAGRFIYICWAYISWDVIFLCKMPIIAENETLCCSYILKIKIMITEQALKRSSDCKIEIYEELGALASSLI